MKQKTRQITNYNVHFLNAISKKKHSIRERGGLIIAAAGGCCCCKRAKKKTTVVAELVEECNKQQMQPKGNIF